MIMYLKRIGIIVLMLCTTGCSMLFVEGPPSRIGPTTDASDNCTRHKALPILDMILGSAYGIRSIMFMATPIPDTEARNRATIAIPMFALGALHFVSGVRGNNDVERCREYLRSQGNVAPAPSPPSSRVGPGVRALSSMALPP